NGVHAKFTRILDMLFRNIRLGAMRSDAHNARSGIVGSAQIVHRTHARQQKSRDLGMADSLGHRLDPLKVGMCTKTVVEARARQTIAVRYLDGIDTGFVKCLGDLTYVVQAVLMSDSVAAVAQRTVR